MMTRLLKVKTGDPFKVGTVFYQNGHRSMPGGWPRSTLFVGAEESHLEVPRLLQGSVGIEGACLKFPTRSLLSPWTNKRLMLLDKCVFLGLYVDLPNEVLTGMELLLPRWSSRLVVEAGDIP